MTIKEQREKLAELGKEIRKLQEQDQDPGFEWTAEVNERWDKLNAEFESRKLTYERTLAAGNVTQFLEAADPNVRPDRETRQTTTDTTTKRRKMKITPETRALSIQAWVYLQRGIDLTEEQRSAAEICGMNLRATEQEIELERRYKTLRERIVREFRALGVANPTEGQETVPEGFVYELEKALLAYNGVRQAASVIRTASGNPLPWPTTDDTANAGSLIAENTQASETDPAFGQTTFGAYKFSSDLVRVAYELIQDSAFDMASELGAMLGERIGRIQEQYFTTGTGTAQPQGILTGATSVAAAANNAITYDDLVDLEHSVDPAYRAQGPAFMMHDLILAELKKLKDLNGLPIWNPTTMQYGTPATLLGYPYYVNQHMPSAIAATTDLVVFGALRKYKVRDAGGLRLMRSAHKYMDFDQETFVAFQRSDGQLLDAGTNPVKKLTTPV